MSAEARPLPVVLCWHMHQPDYRDPERGRFHLPWVYLHGIKDYVDMAAHLEAAPPEARAVVNFAPVLLEQLADYSHQIQAWLERGEPLRDPLLAALAEPDMPSAQAQREMLLHACQRANEKRLVDRFPTYRELVDLARWLGERPHLIGYLDAQFLADLLVWYHLAWMGEEVRRQDPRVQALEERRRGYSPEDRRQLVALIGELLGGLAGRYRRLAEQGRVELSITPYAHPIMPLLLDLESAREAMPEVALPAHPAYPAGEERVRWHLRNGVAVFERHFGIRPLGCWPSEGALSLDTLRILGEEGFRWTASGQEVLRHSLSAGLEEGRGLPEHWPYQPYQAPGGELACFFRDDGLSDLIGFTYADWHGDDAVANLMQHLETIEAASRDQPNRVLSIIMDGENAWEYYPANASFFLSALYRRLSEHPRVRLTTYGEWLRHPEPLPKAPLPRLVSGSWVYGTLSTWIGDPDKNRAWDMLIEAKATYDRVLAAGRLDPARQAAVARQLAVCEGSDWFWWFGDYNPAETVSDFECLYRQQLIQLYRLLEESPPDYLFKVFARGEGHPEHGGVMRKN